MSQSVRPVDGQARGLASLTIPAAPRTPWLCVAGAKGGVGKTTLAVNLALLLQRAGHRTLLVDLDAGCGNVAVHLRLPTAYDLDDVATGRCTARQAVQAGPGGLAVLLGRSGASALTHDGERLLPDLFAALSTLAGDYDVVVCDTGAGVGPLTLAAAERADLVIGATTPDVAALTDAYALCKVLHGRGRPLPHLVVNRSPSREVAMRTAAKLAAVTRKFLGTESRLLGLVSDDPALERSVVTQSPLAIGGRSPALDDLQALAAAVIGALPGGLRRRPTAPPTPAPAPATIPALPPRPATEPMVRLRPQPLPAPPR